jgi:hypothetical protein
MIAAGVNAKALSVFMGHFSIKVTFDLYGHPMPAPRTGGSAARRVSRWGLIDRAVLRPGASPFLLDQASGAQTTVCRGQGK